MTARLISTRVLCEVLRHKNFLDRALVEQLQGTADKRDIRLAQELSYGVMRWYHQLTFIAAQLLKKPFKERDTDLHALILSGLYQLKYMRIPDHAAISATVETTAELGKPWARNLVNAVLRRYQREKAAIDNAIDKSLPASSSHPPWIIEKLKSQWPDDWQGILRSNNSNPPLHLRLDLGKSNREDYAKLLETRDIESFPAQYVNTGIGLVRPLPVEDIPGFREGIVSVQDFSAQLAAALLDCQPGSRILDACAAPGGKSAHILELATELQELVCIDISAERLKQLQGSLERLGRNAIIITADLNLAPDWWDGTQFDRILLDAPCSASGVIRRHPDIKFTRSEEQLVSLTRNQFSFLENLWPLLKTSGKLLYCTCSVFKEESTEQIAKFTSQHNNARIITINADWGVKSEFGRHTIPGLDEGDGFFYSIVEKTLD